VLSGTLSCLALNIPPKLELVSAKLGYSILSPAAEVEVEVSANLASVVMARIASPRVGVIAGESRIGASCTDVDDEGGVGWGLSRRFGLRTGESTVEGEVEANEMNEGPELVDRLVERFLGGVYRQPRSC
jgi:hypothetical protein